MGTYTKISQNAFDELSLDAGVLLTAFDPASPSAPDSAIVCATTGGININCTPTFSDLAEDVDNAPANLMEFKHLDKWECTIGFTSLGTSPSLLKLALGCADISNTTKVVPRRDLSQSDFAHLWWVGDKANGGFVAVKLFNMLSTGGLSLQTTKNGKGQISVTLTGHPSLSDPTVVPMEFYSIDPADPVTYVYTAVTSPTGNPASLGYYVLVGDEYRLTSDTTVDSNVTYYTRSTAT